MSQADCGGWIRTMTLTRDDPYKTTDKTGFEDDRQLKAQLKGYSLGPLYKQQQSIVSNSPLAAKHWLHLLWLSNYDEDEKRVRLQFCHITLNRDKDGNVDGYKVMPKDKRDAGLTEDYKVNEYVFHWDNLSMPVLVRVVSGHQGKTGASLERTPVPMSPL